jgi:hypothetical protein
VNFTGILRDNGDDFGRKWCCTTQKSWFVWSDEDKTLNIKELNFFRS